MTAIRISNGTEVTKLDLSSALPAVDGFNSARSVLSIPLNQYQSPMISPRPLISPRGVTTPRSNGVITPRARNLEKAPVHSLTVQV